ncbi:hypothetical protein BCR44DRAFT_1437293 [Catenaria anguillulae PL171]|uniref:J domain-containing protein n=1 Tax=Catenaria anguillulae PL171 TaxID=765915 RepID=A0A1Y2HH76_9FUNG|nr:hypothetical protein BCR44DRAFT_1437293 [Catenaria anguillulae PL171]
MSRSRTRHTADETDNSNGHDSTATMTLTRRCTGPDRLSSQPKEAQDEAKSKFQSISLAYSILIDPAKRKRYDLTGRLDSLAPTLGDDDDPAAYFQDLYDSCVTPESIAEFRAEYQGSTDERVDVLAAYVKHEGDMDGILSEVPCSTVDDEDRFAALIREAIEQGKVEAYARFMHEDPKAKKKRKREAEREAKEAEEMARELGLKDAKRAKKGAQADEEDALRQLILRNQSRRANAFESMMDRIETKYAGNGTPKSSSPNRGTSQQKSKSRGSRKRDHGDEEEDELESDGDENGSEGEGDGDGDEHDESDQSEEEDELAAEPVRRSSRKR